MFDVEELKNSMEFDLEYAKQYTTVDTDHTQMLDTRAPYRLLAYMASKYDNIRIYDLGTYRGMSSLALAANPNNKVISYDILDQSRVKLMDNIEYKIGNFYEDPEILNSPLISLDIDPHDGPAETKFFNWLIENNYKGTIICDDINLNQGMKDFWQNIPAEIEKHDVSSYGHNYGGTGIVFFK